MRAILLRPTLITYDCSYVISQNNYHITHTKNKHKISSYDRKVFHIPLKLEYDIQKLRIDTIDKSIFQKYLNEIDKTTEKYNMDELLYENKMMLRQIIHIINYNTILGIIIDEKNKIII
jgi:hypothetical protein